MYFLYFLTPQQQFSLIEKSPSMLHKTGLLVTDRWTPWLWATGSCKFMLLYLVTWLRSCAVLQLGWGHIYIPEIISMSLQLLAPSTQPCKNPDKHLLYCFLIGAIYIIDKLSKTVIKDVYFFPLFLLFSPFPFPFPFLLLYYCTEHRNKRFEDGNVLVLMCNFISTAWAHWINLSAKPLRMF